MDDDKKLVQKTLDGEKRAFEMIVRRYQKPLFNYIQRMVGNRELALDLTQDIFVKIYSSLDSYRFQYKFRTWMFKIASNSLIDYFRKKRIDTFSYEQKEKRDSPSTFQIPDDEDSVVKTFELSNLRKRIEQALEKIPPQMRELFVWRHINEFSYKEIAEIKEMPVGTIKNKVFQAKEMLRRLLEGLI
ncbi:sigma-70 family RNA polymerase sigma factor [bacterium]|nr:sigma-70 family RNA polymerase sigma factor [bacterium]